ncbi:MAG: glycoside hydrolase family 97 catalytic domain-containing protein, partial [Flavobacteriales bacterium]
MRFPLIIAILFASIPALNAQEFELKSPDEKIRVELIISANTVYRVYYGSKLLMHGKPIGLTVGKKNTLGKNEFEPKITRTSVDQIVEPVVSYRSKQITEKYDQLSVAFDSGLSIDFRCYNDGFAYRLNTSFERESTIKEESMGFELTSNPNVWFPKEKGFFSSNEKQYHTSTSQELKKGEKASLPILWQWEKGPFLFYTETDLHDYPEMYLKTDGDGGYEAVFPKVPATYFKAYDRFELVGFKKPYIAQTQGTRSYPWRVFGIANNEKDLIGIQLPYLLASPTKIEQTDWIKPGKVAWDWWNAVNLQGVDFKPGMNTETYKYYIDFAAENNLEYIIMDEGWYKLGNLLEVKKEIDMPELIRYAKSKNVEIILWVVWRTLKKQFDEAFTQFSDWGIAGIKMDFMNRHDQVMVNFYERVAKESAKRKLLVDFHGSHSPKGLQRTYPNVLTYEGLLGLEQVKWSKWVHPDHDVILPFTRMLAGPMDYTPGAMRNASSKERHQIKFKSPESIG